MIEPETRDGEDGDFARPFLTAARFPTDRAAGQAAGMPARDGWDERGPLQVAPPEADEFVRPYLVTGGRVHDGLGDFSTVYALTATGRAKLGTLTFELRQIAELCAEAQSVAEISAHLRLPLGVVTVLARDLADAGDLAAASTTIDPGSDLTLITRLIHAVHAL